MNPTFNTKALYTFAFQASVAFSMSTGPFDWFTYKKRAMSLILTFAAYPRHAGQSTTADAWIENERRVRYLARSGLGVLSEDTARRLEIKP